jgi:hypothetical protein
LTIVDLPLSPAPATTIRRSAAVAQRAILNFTPGCQGWKIAPYGERSPPGVNAIVCFSVCFYFAFSRCTFSNKTHFFRKFLWQIFVTTFIQCLKANNVYLTKILGMNSGLGHYDLFSYLETCSSTLYCLEEEWRGEQIISFPGDNFTPRGQLRPWGSQFAPRGEVKNGPRCLNCASSTSLDRHGRDRGMVRPQSGPLAIGPWVSVQLPQGFFQAIVALYKGMPVIPVNKEADEKRTIPR